jgi:uncharacterized protein
MRRFPSRKAIGLAVLWAVAAWAGPDDVLKSLEPRGRVTDLAGVFASEERAALETWLLAVDARTGAEIAVVALRTLDGGEVDDFAVRLFEKWGIGKKGKDNGVLILAAIDDRHARIEVGYGLEAVLPDAAAGRILDEAAIPLFREGLHGEGLSRAAQAVAARIGGDALSALTNTVPAFTTVVATAAAPADGAPGGFPTGAIVFLVFVAVIILLGVFTKKSGRGGGSSGSSGSSGGSVRSSSSSSRSSFGGGRSGGGGASRGW